MRTTFSLSSRVAAGPDRPAGQRADGAAAADRSTGGRAIAAAYAPPVVAAATMTFLGLWGLTRDSAMGNDEVATRWAAILSLGRLRHLLSNVDAVHGLYYLLMHGWMAVGTSPTVIRIPSVISMVAAVAMTAIAARRLTGSGWAGLLTGLIMAVTPNISYYAQTARSYALVVACVMAATLSLLRVMEAEAVGVTGARLASRWLLYGALVTLSGYLNELSLMILAAHAVTVLLARAGWRTVGRWAVTAAAVAVLVTPLVAISVREDGAVGWIARPSLDDLRILFHNDFGATTAVAVFLLGCAVAAAAPPLGTWRHGGAPAAAGAGVPRERAWWASGGISLPSVAVPLLIMPPLVLMAESLVAHPLYVDRYVLYTETGAALLAGAGIHRISRWLAGVAGRRSLRWAPGAIVCACALLFQLGPQHTVRSPASREFNYGAPSSYIGAHARPGDGVLFFNSFFRKARLGYPSDFRKISDFAMSVSPAQAGTFNGRDKPFAVIRPLMLQRRRIWVVGRAPSAKLGSWPIRHESMLLQQRFALVAERQFRGIIVTLWLRR